MFSLHPFRSKLNLIVCIIVTLEEWFPLKFDFMLLWWTYDKGHPCLYSSALSLSHSFVAIFYISTYSKLTFVFLINCWTGFNSSTSRSKPRWVFIVIVLLFYFWSCIVTLVLLMFKGWGKLYYSNYIPLNNLFYHSIIWFLET